MKRNEDFRGVVFVISQDDASFSALFHAHPVPMWVYDLETLGFVAVNAAAIAHYGYTEEEFLGMSIRDIRPPCDLARLDDNLQKNPVPNIEKAGIWVHRKKNGALIDVEISSHPLLFREHACKFVLAHDVTERLLAQRKVVRLSRIYSFSSGINAAIARIHTRDALFEEVCRIAVNVGAFLMAWIGAVDQETQDGEVVAWCGGNEGLIARITLSARPDAPGAERPASTAIRERRPVIVNSIANEPTLRPVMAEALRQGHRSVAALPLRSDNRVVAVMVLSADTEGFFDDEEIKLLDEMVGDLNFALQFIDNEKRLSYLAFYDALTGLANGTLFEDRLTQFIHANLPGSHRVGVILLNIDRFAQLNDALGRQAGDLLLKVVGRRLDESLPGGASLARIGGATFAIAIPEIASSAEMERILEQDILAQTNQNYQFDMRDIPVSARAGLALYPSDGEDAETLFKHAEVALKNAKSSGDRFLFYSPTMNAAHSARLALEAELQRALDHREFVVHYQPRIDLASGRIVSAEALIRWQHPTRGLILPGTFITLAEEIGMIVPIGDWVLNTVCAQQASWLKEHVDVVPVAVNLSAIQFKNGKVLHSIPDAFVRHGLAPRYVEFELTESMVMSDPNAATRSLKELKALGTQLSLDDFGTGYSSLAYLQRFPFDFVKIDRSFIAEVNTNPGNAAIATAIIAMAHSLHLRVVAEGVETEGQLQFLRKRHCDEIQGFFFSEAVPAEAFAAMLAAKKQLPLPAEVDDDTLLIVDDEENILAALRRLLRREGFRVLTANSGKEGLDLLAVNRVQVIISDQRMPGMSGTEFLAIAKELYPDTIRMILSGYADLTAVTDSVNQGEVYKFMTKPWDDSSLKAIIREAFRAFKQRS
jgi:diguanylate cyclase (GGDEF)-like protein/PAS domain S-box-containing protein